LPVGYPHWSYGKEFIRNEQAYRRGMQGLAYEIVINSNPCIAYLMEENTMATQALVIAHASYGHNSFFKGNHLFRQWTSADAILDYLVFARRYVMECEERHGATAVEEVLDACHALMPHGVDRYRRPAALTLKARRHGSRSAKPTASGSSTTCGARFRNRRPVERPRGARGSRRPAGKYPLLHREILAEARALAARAGAHRAEAGPILLSASPDQGDERRLGDVLALHDPQSVAREGVGRRRLHARIPEEPHQRRCPAGFRFEGLQRAQSVRAGVRDVPRFKAHLRGADAEDREWFPQLVGTDWKATLDFAMRNFKDESFIAQYLSPRLIREFHLFAVADHVAEDTLHVDCIHDERGYRRVRKLLAQQHAQELRVPDVQVVRYDRDGDRSLTLRHIRRRGRPLTEATAEVVLHLRRLWGFAVRLETWENELRVGDVVECSA
jgi:stage V sporulation protein R